MPVVVHLKADDSENRKHKNACQRDYKRKHGAERGRKSGQRHYTETQRHCQSQRFVFRNAGGKCGRFGNAGSKFEKRN